MKESNDIQAIQRLREKLETDPQVQRYRQLGKKVHENENLLTLYKEYINQQKELVNLDYYQVSEAKKQKIQEMKLLEERLLDNPLFNEYIQLQVELEELFQTMAHLIEEGVNKGLS